MTGKERVWSALNHKEPDAVPVDFGGTAVTGMHVDIVIALRDRYGLEKRPVKVHEPYQMLGFIDEGLKRALGIDIEGVYGAETIFGFRNENWKPWRMDNGPAGTQSSTFCSVNTFRSLYMPYYKQVNAWVHENTRWKTFKHSCGAVETLIPAFIESGFDILNPVQVSAAGMDAGKLKSKYGKDIVFWGGGVDTQRTLMFGTPGDVRAEVLERCGTFGKDGGFIFNAVHNIQANVPAANVVAMLEAVKEFNGK